MVLNQHLVNSQLHQASIQHPKSIRRKREDDSISKAETPSKKVREDLRNEDRKEEDDRSREDLGKT